MQLHFFTEKIDDIHVVGYSATNGEGILLCGEPAKGYDYYIDGRFKNIDKSRKTSTRFCQACMDELLKRHNSLCKITYDPTLITATEEPKEE